MSDGEDEKHDENWWHIHKNVVIPKPGIMVDVKLASDDKDDKKSKDSVKRVYDDLDGDSTVGDLKKKMESFLAKESKQGYAIYRDEARKNAAADNTKLSEIGKVNAEYQLNGQTQYIVYAQKTYPEGSGLNTKEACDDLIDQVVDMDNAAYFALADLKGSSVVLQNLIDILGTMFKEVDKDPLLQTVVYMLKNKDFIAKRKDTLLTNKKEMRRLLLSMGIPKQSISDQVAQWATMIATGIGLMFGIKAGVKYGYKKFMDGRRQYGPQTQEQAERSAKWKGRRKWAGRVFKGVEWAASALAMGFAIKQMVDAADAEKEYWANNVKVIEKERNKRYDDYEEVALYYDGISQTCTRLKDIFVLYFPDQCTDKLKAGMTQPTYSEITSDPNQASALATLVTEVSSTAVQVQLYMNTLAGMYKELNSSMATQRYNYVENPATKTALGGEEGYLKMAKSVAGYDMFIAIKSADLKANNKPELPAGEKSKFVDVYFVWLMGHYFALKEEQGKTQDFASILLASDKGLESIAETFGANKPDNVDAFIRQMRIQYIFLDGVNRSTSTPKEAPQFTISFLDQIAEIYKANKLPDSE